MSTDKLYHYTYIITNVIENKYYIGCRSCHILPEKDLGVKYFSSSKDKEFRSDQKTNPQNYNYKIIAVFSNRGSAVMLEIKLHSIHDVGVNPKFYNRAKQTALGWDTTGVDITALKRKKAIEKELKKLMPKRKVVMSDSQKAHLRALRTGFRHSEESKAKMSKARIGRTPMLGKKHKEDTKAKMSLDRTGKTHSLDTLEILRKCNLGVHNPAAKLANIYDSTTNSVIAENVVISEWCRENGYSKSSLSATANSDRNAPHHWKTNPLSTKGVYAVYL